MKFGNSNMNIFYGGDTRKGGVNLWLMQILAHTKFAGNRQHVSHFMSLVIIQNFDPLRRGSQKECTNKFHLHIRSCVERNIVICEI